MKDELLALLKKEAFFKKRIKLSSGKSSNYYIDVRKVSLTPRGIYLISRLVFRLIQNSNINAIGGPTLGADPVVSGVCFLAARHKQKLKGFIVRKSPKKHGRQKLIEGQLLVAGDRAVIVDDVATSGSSLLKTIAVLRREKVRVVKALVIVDRKEGAAEALAAQRCPLISIFTRDDFF